LIFKTYISSLAGTSRFAKEDITLGDYKLAKGTVVLALFLPTHYREDYFNDAFHFKPERWLNESSENQNMTAAWMPFSKGERSCIGQRFAMLELKAVLATIYKKLIFRADPYRGYEYGRRITVQPVGLHLIPRIRT
jgi:cytochrome P450